MRERWCCDLEEEEEGVRRRKGGGGGWTGSRLLVLQCIRRLLKCNSGVSSCIIMEAAGGAA